MEIDIEHSRTDSPPEWPHLTATTLADAAYLAVRDQIVVGTLRPGEFIRERAVSTALRVSRTPLREAFGRLASEGFLQRVANRGYRVPALPVQELLDLYPMVTALETLAARESLPLLTRADVEALRQENGAMLDAIAAADAAAAIRANERFHRRLTGRCANARLTKLLDDLRSQLAVLELWSANQPDLNDEAARQHRDIIRAVARGKFETALSVLEANRLQTRDALTAHAARDRPPAAKRAGHRTKRTALAGG